MSKISKLDKLMVDDMRKWGIPILRVMLGIVFLWFGALKIFGVTPVTDLVGQTYSFFPVTEFLVFLGVWEVVIGIGLILKIFLRSVLAILWLQMLGTFIASILEPSMFFNGNIFLLTIEGEFLVKNLVLVASGIVIGGHEVKKRK